MISEQGRRQLQDYETFLMNVNWLMAKLAAQTVSLELAIEEFMTCIADLNEEMFVGRTKEEMKQVNDLDNYFREICCPTCGLYGKSGGGYQDIYSVEA